MSQPLQINRSIIVKGDRAAVFAALTDLERLPEIVGAIESVERTGERTAARNALGFTEAVTDAPFFWSHHYDVSIAYVGHAPAWDALEIDGSFEEKDVAVRYRLTGTVLALATVGRSAASLEFEAELEAGFSRR